jgi:DegV family protein with EDD domain
MFRIVIDSAGDLPAGWTEEFDIQVIPINIHFGEQTFLQGVDLSNADFYRIARESGVIPKTLQPSPQQFVDFYHKIAQPGDTILSIHVTGKLSGTMSSCEIAARDMAGDFIVIPFDSACGSAGMGFMAREARLLERSGEPVEKIIRKLELIRSHMQIILTLDTLEFARRSGRVKALQAALASLLNVKPIIFLTNGVLELGERVRTRSRSIEYVVDQTAKRLGSQPAKVAVVHSQDPDSAQALELLARQRLNIQELITTELSIGIAANLGPGTVGLIAYPVAEPA